MFHKNNEKIHLKRNKSAQRALGRSPEEKVKGQGEAIILLEPNIGR